MPIKEKIDHRKTEPEYGGSKRTSENIFESFMIKNQWNFDYQRKQLPSYLTRPQCNSYQRKQQSSYLTRPQRKKFNNSK